MNTAQIVYNINITAAIATALLIIVILLMYIAFYKDVPRAKKKK